MTRETFNMDFVTDLKAQLETAPKSTSKLSKADVLRQLIPNLRELRETKDYTLEALVELLGQKGLNVKVSTLQGALKRKGTKKTKVVTDPPAAQPVPPKPEKTAAPGPGMVTGKSAKAA
jgi:hypothetical protein